MTANKPTLAHVRKLARARWGKTADVRHNPKAMTQEEKDAEHARRKARQADRDRMKAELVGLGDTAKALREAARFCVDVDAQEPTLSQLRTAVERAEHAADLRESIGEIEADLRVYRAHASRYEAFTNQGWCTTHCDGADTLEELAAKIEAK